MKNQECSFFVEACKSVQMSVDQQGPQQTHHEVTSGVSMYHDGLDYRSYKWYPLTRGLSLPTMLPTAVCEKIRTLHDTQLKEQLDWHEILNALLLTIDATCKRGVRADLSLNASNQQVAINNASDWDYDQRCYATLGVRIFADTNNSEKSISCSYAYSSVRELLDALPDLVDPICSQVPIAVATLQTMSCPSGEMPIILSPGQSAVFFHEVCGHPLEGDIVASGTSYLAPWIGSRVAEEYVNLVDDPTPGSSKMSHRIDDEGTLSRTVHLLEHGIVREPLLDKRNAQILKLEPNGHGRRLDFRHYAIPRMTHTQVLSHSGTLQEALNGIQHGLMISRLRLRHMSIANGDFSFIIQEARIINDGVLGPYINNGLLHGNGLQCLRAIDFVGADNARFFTASVGCGKLDQWPLVVSGGQPTVRFRKLRVEPWC